MSARLAAVLVVVVAACASRSPWPEVDPARFAPRPEWTPARYAIATGAAPVAAATPVSADDVIEDLAFLETMLERAWADGPKGVGWGREYARDRMHELAARGATTAGQLCESLVDWLNNTSLAFRFNGETSNRVGRVDEAPTPPLHAPAPGANYAWTVEDEGADTPIGVLTIVKLADPSDPGWAGFDLVLRDLTTVDLVVLDLQAAAGDDPRMGFAVLAALGLERYRVIGAPVIHDGPYADVARANRAATASGPIVPRSRALWTTFDSIDAIAKIARSIGPSRVAPSQVVIAHVIVGSGCERACHMIAALAERNEGHVAMSGWSFGTGGDEPGAIRLPHSGIEVRFATAWYPGSESIGRFDSTADPTAAVADLRARATVNPDAVAWRRRAPPDCATLPIDPAPKISGCATQLPADPTAVVDVFVNLKVDEDTARRFLATCPGLRTGTVLPTAERQTLTTVSAPVETVRRLASSPLPLYIETSCPMHPE